jgi:formiminoglutamase
MSLISSDNNYLASYVSKRTGEVRLGEVLKLFSVSESKNYVDALSELKQQGVNYILLGIPEDIGPRANLGKPGSDKGWDAFLYKFCALQQNEFIRGEEIAVMGHIDCEDLQDKSVGLNSNQQDDLNSLRALVEELDKRVTTICKMIFDAKITPIIIGGGHNNAYPIIRAASLSLNSSIGAINLDPHTDFRMNEGRHSGNGFSYAAKGGYLQYYFSLGMNELKNSAANIESLKSYGFQWASYQDIWVRRTYNFDAALAKGKKYLNDTNLDFGIELDVDCLSMMPASAFTNCGIQVQDAEYYVSNLATELKSCYLHLAEGAPEQHPINYNAGVNDVGQVYALLVSSFIQAKQSIKVDVKRLI